MELQELKFPEVTEDSPILGARPPSKTPRIHASFHSETFAHNTKTIQISLSAKWFSLDTHKSKKLELN
jgi:hypothetical protein